MCVLTAQGLCAGLTAPEADEVDQVSRGEAYVGADVTSFWYYGYAGTTFAPFGNYEDTGFRLHVYGEAGQYFYESDDGRIYGTTTAVDVLAGYAFEAETYSLHFYVGPNVITHTLSRPDPSNPAQGVRVGAKVQATLDANPTPQTLVTGMIEYSSAFDTYYGIARFGYSLTRENKIFAGPEVTVMGDDFYSQWRIGGHLTMPIIGDTKLSLSAGFLSDDRSGRGAYGAVVASVPF
jgi:hypothetical protein